MKIVDCEQGSADWFFARLGIPTASNFHKIVTPAKCELSKQARFYAYSLIVEKLLNQPSETVEGQRWMEHGKEYEPKAVAQYEFLQEVETHPVGFITTDDGLIGASPDRLVKGKAIGIEIKCPAPNTHLGYLLEGPGDHYKPQVQGQLWVAELERADFYAYHPRMPAKLIETGRDEEYIRKLAAAVLGFNEQLFEMTERARSLGVFQAAARMLTPIEQQEADELGEAYREEMLYPPEGAFR